MSGVFVGVSEILKKERNESTKERKIEETEWFVVSQRRRRHQKKVKQGESIHGMILKVMKTIISMLFEQLCFLGEKIFPKLENVPLWKKFFFLVFLSHFFFFFSRRVLLNLDNEIPIYEIFSLYWKKKIQFFCYFIQLIWYTQIFFI